MQKLRRKEEKCRKLFCQKGPRLFKSAATASTLKLDLLDLYYYVESKGTENGKRPVSKLKLDSIDFRMVCIIIMQNHGIK